MTNHSLTQIREQEMLLTALGSTIQTLLEDEHITDILLNPDGKIWAESLTQGKFFTGIYMEPAQSQNIIKLVASLHYAVADMQNPEISAELLDNQIRFQGWLPPITDQPSFAMRKHANHIFSLDDYLAKEQLSTGQLQDLRQAVLARKNILIAGGTSSGKTTFVNALLHELKNTSDRIIVLEDTLELQISTPDYVRLKTSPEKPMQALVKGTLRMRPDRIIVGEVRDGTALDLLKAWNTGHPGGISTIHANSSAGALERLEDLMQEVIPIVPKRLIQQAIDMIVFMKRDPEKGYQVSELLNIS